MFMSENDRRKQEYLESRFKTSCGLFVDAKDLGNTFASTPDGSTSRVPSVSCD